MSLSERNQGKTLGMKYSFPAPLMKIALQGQNMMILSYRMTGTMLGFIVGTQ